MKFSYNWIQTHIKESLPSPEEIYDVIFAHAFEIESMEKIGSDTVFDINVLPNRAADCFSHYGLARELAGLLGFTLLPLDTSLPVLTKKEDFISITSSACTRYVAIKISNITITQTPEVIKTRLEAVGQQSINAVVDIANAIMLDIGQPIHIFDADNVDGGIVVRNAREGEKIISLSNEEKELTPEMLVIADILGPLAIAGVKGGKGARVTTETKNIIIEVAKFDAKTIGKTARALGLLTDAAKRYENNVPASCIDSAVAACVGLLHTTVGGTIEWVQDINHTEQKEEKIRFTATQIGNSLGLSLTPEIISDICTRYNYTCTRDGERFEITVPLWRPDILGVHDLVEEFGRIYGYEYIEPKVLPVFKDQEENNSFIRTGQVKQYLAANGFIEVHTYTFTKKGELEVAYGPKGKSALRNNLSDLLKESYELNQKNAPLFGKQKMKIFEIGTVFFKDREEIHVATVDGGIVQEQSIDAFLESHPEALLFPKSYTPFSQTPHPFSPWSVYPFVTRDIAVWVPDGQKEKFEKIISDFATEYCVRMPDLFDSFTKEGRTSLAYRFVFQSPEKTLTSSEVDTWWNKLIEEIKKNPDFEMR